MRFRMKISYDGARYAGWQIQPNAPSIQGEIERALALLLKKETRVVGSGRTDSGAHALGQVAHFDADETVSLHALNGILPHDIRIHSLEEAEEGFHAQYSATGKIYHYHLWLERVADPFAYRYSHRVQIDPAILERKEAFIGTHDFKSFANLGSSVKTTVRTIHRVDVVEQRGGVRLEFEGSGFLYKMVRNMVGALLDPHADIPALLAARDRRAVGACAPAHGLFLMQVEYENCGCGEKRPLCSEHPHLLVAAQS